MFVCVWLKIRDCLDYTVVVMDGGTLTAELHERGVNVRYLGTLLEQLENTGEGKRLAHVQVYYTTRSTYLLGTFRYVIPYLPSQSNCSFFKRVAISELIIRSAKHIFKTYLQVRIPIPLENIHLFYVFFNLFY